MNTSMHICTCKIYAWIIHKHKLHKLCTQVVYEYIHEYIHAHILHARIHTCMMSMCVCKYARACMFVCICVCMYTYNIFCMHVCLCGRIFCVYVRVCAFACICIMCVAMRVSTCIEYISAYVWPYVYINKAQQVIYKILSFTLISKQRFQPRLSFFSNL